ncbi:acyl-CoA N-acyltransferase [Aspergillus affinis]|uniref:acyl-CoA N-acyltransferase n=1 Tax=Aspergillus affinis TaxID=1070780 RepID=UPI0022FE4F8D|nr:acyl-CoA N-acyltransferase [Aspergillus affinis]KAI9041889.1 acyl-CoA N-acyltransferase [Aspergillus affinis]
MSYAIQPAFPADVPECFAVAQKAYVELNSLLYHTIPFSPETTAQMIQSRVDSFQTNPRTRNVKAVDSESGAIIGYVRWTTHPDGQVLEQTVEEVVEARLTPRIPEMREGVARAIHTIMQRDMREILGSKEEGEDENAEVRRLIPHVHVDALFTHPDHQRKGVARALLQTCLREADELGIVTFLEATQDGKPLYLKSGFDIVRTCEVDPTKYGGVGRHDLTVSFALILG